MENKLISIVYAWLSHCHIPVSRRYLHSRLASHYAYPSILSVTDLLDEWGIENAAIIVDKEKLDTLPAPFLIETNQHEPSFLLIKDVRTDMPKDPDFISNWNGLVLVMERPTKFHDAENTKWLKKESNDKKIINLSLVALLAIFGFGLYFHFSWIVLGLFTISTVGLFISILSVQQSLGIDNSIVNQICTGDNKSNCSAVSQSSQSRILGQINFSDLALGWFSSCTIALIIGLLTTLYTQVIQILSLTSLLAIPVTLVSIYYQRWVIRSWCRLCLIIIALVWLQLAILVPQLSFQYYAELPSHLLLAFFIATAVLLGWIALLKPIFKYNLELVENNFTLKRFKNNPAVFEWALKRKRAIDTSIWDDDLQTGNRLSPIQIVVACNPYCNPCAAVHKILHDIVEKKEIGLIIRFSLVNTDRTDPITQAASYILQILKDKPDTYKRKALERWYADMDMEKFSKQYPLHAEVEISGSLSRLVKWSEKSRIKYTPTIFINGYQLPGMYHPTDLPYLINNMINHPDNTNQPNESMQKLQIS